MNDDTSPKQSDALFPNTMWTLVMQSRDDSNPEARRKKLDQLCRTYWNPLFRYATWLGNPPENAKDLTQGFFVYMLTKDFFDKAEKGKGKLRTLMLSWFKNFIHGEYDKTTAKKRGGAEGTLSLDWLNESGDGDQVENEDNSTPETLYDKQCAIAVLAAAANGLEERYKAADKLDWFKSLRQFITVSGNAESYGEEATKIGVRADYYKVLVQRFRGEFKEVLKSTVKETLPEDATENDIKEEILEIFRLAYS